MRLVTFLGTSEYKEANYSFDNKTYRSRYVAHALTEFLDITEVIVLATEEAWKKNGKDLEQILLAAKRLTVQSMPISAGIRPQESWQLFDAIVDAIQDSDFDVLLDITHGFRMQPFFAAACVAFVQSVSPKVPSIRVVYGEYRSEGDSPIHELTSFVDLLAWTRSLMLFLRTGQVDGLWQRIRNMDHDLHRKWASNNSQGERPKIGKLRKALEDFGEQLVTVRTGSLLVGDNATAKYLFDTLVETQEEIAREMPPLAKVIGQIQDMVKPLLLEGARFNTKKGQQGLHALATLYCGLGRFSEAYAVAREGQISRQAPDEADTPNTQEFLDEKRKEFDKKWGEEANEIFEFRNDLLHAGFRQRPLPANTIINKLDDILNSWKQKIDKMPES